MSLFRLEGVTVAGVHRPVLDAVDLELAEAGVTVVIGPSGAGKSTLLRLLNRLVAPDAGRVLFRDADTAELDARRLRRRVGMVFQRPTVFGGTVRDNLAVAAPDASDGDMVDALARAELPGAFLDREAAELSGGEAQRACVARALLTAPEVLLMDEPTSALDRVPRLGLEALARHLAGAGTPVVWVTHQLDQMRRLADHVVVLIEGRLRYAGPPSDLDALGDLEVVELVRGDHGDAG